MSDDKKKKKKALQLKKNRTQQEIFNIFRLRRQEADRVDKEKEALAPKPADVSSGEETERWGDKVAIVRNRLTDKKRASRERWNRFAGTGDEGGRGL